MKINHEVLILAIFHNEEPVTLGVGAHRVPSVPKRWSQSLRLISPPIQVSLSHSLTLDMCLFVGRNWLAPQWTWICFFKGGRWAFFGNLDWNPWNHGTTTWRNGLKRVFGCRPIFPGNYIFEVIAVKNFEVIAVKNLMNIMMGKSPCAEGNMFGTWNPTI